MSARHLDATTWASLQHTRDDELLAHLEQGCDVCEAFLATVPGVEGAVDVALLSLSPRAASTDELAWQRFAKKRAARPQRAWVLVVAAAAVVLLVSGALALRERPGADDGWNGVKGSVPPGTLRLRAASRPASGAAGAELVPLRDGSSVRSSSTLVFRADSSVTGPARLFVQRGRAAPVEVAQLGLTHGVQDLEREGQGLLGFELSGEAGPLVLTLVAGDAPFSTQTALEAVNGAGVPGMVVGKIRLDVTP